MTAVCNITRDFFQGLRTAPRFAGSMDRILLVQLS
jgi:hypothetical protein